MKTEHGIIHLRSQGFIDFAYAYAKDAHEGQVRRYTNEPYITHPVAVAKIVQSVTEDCDMVAAAILHDVLEDTPKTYDDILNKFGFRCAQFVLELTEFSVESDGNRTIRKELDKRYLSRTSAQTKTIKLADCIHNSESIILYGKGFRHIYMKEISELIEELKVGNEKLYYDLSKIIENFNKAYDRKI